MNNDRKVSGINVRLAMGDYTSQGVDQLHSIAPELLQAIVEVEQILSARRDREKIHTLRTELEILEDCPECQDREKYAMNQRYSDDICWSIKRLKRAMSLVEPRT